MKFYTKKGINFMIRLGEIFAFQKAYSLLYGVVVQIHYNYTRFTLMVQRALIQVGHILKNKTLTAHILTVRSAESKKFNDRVMKIEHSDAHTSIEYLDTYMAMSKYIFGGTCQRTTYRQNKMNYENLCK